MSSLITDLFKKFQIIICCTDEIITDAHVVITLHLYEQSLYSESQIWRIFQPLLQLNFLQSPQLSLLFGVNQRIEHFTAVSHFPHISMMQVAHYVCCPVIQSSQNLPYQGHIITSLPYAILSICSVSTDNFPNHWQNFMLVHFSKQSISSNRNLPCTAMSYGNYCMH
jgi:hypothetical protein